MSVQKAISIKWKMNLWTVIFSLLSFISHSQVDLVTFKRLSTKDGLSQNWIRCIYQDEFGYMWFGTSGGLNRYDGSEFKIYELGNVSVNALLKKNDHELWICNDIGVFIYDYKNDTTYSFPYLKQKAVLCIKEDIDKQVWFGTDAGLYKFDPSNNKMILYSLNTANNSSLSNNYINSIFEDSDHNLWIGTKSGLNLYQKSTNTFQRYFITGLKGYYSGNDIFRICEDKEKRLWLGTSQNGVILLVKNKKDNPKFYKIVDGYIIGLLIDKQNNLWIGKSSNGGLSRLNLNDFSIDKPPVLSYYLNNLADPKSLSDNSVFCTYQDNSGDIWIGTFGSGLNYYSYRNKKFYAVTEGVNQQPSIKNNLVNAFYEEERYLWIGTEGGLDRYDKINNTSKHFSYESNNPSSIGGNPIFSLFKDSRGNMWVGTWNGGLNLYNYETESFKRFLPDEKPGSISSRNVFSIYEDSHQNLWLGTIGGGLNRYDYKTGKFIQYKHDADNPKSLFSNIIRDILQTKDGRLYIALNESLEFFDYTTNDFKHYPINSEETNTIDKTVLISIFEDSHNNLWMATNKGLALFNQNEKFSIKYNKVNGLPGNIIQGIEEDNHGNLWISTDNGIAKFLNGVNHPNIPVFNNFTDLDGLSGNEFKRRSAFKNKEGIIYFGSSQGYTYFNPDSIFVNKSEPKIVFSEMQLLQSQQDENAQYRTVKNINSIAKIDLNYENSDFVIKFSALNFFNPEKNKYKYKLEGYDNDWINAGNIQLATYKNLQPGTYTFKVLGSNNDGFWSKNPKTLLITIHPPWWKTKALTVLLIILILSVFIGFYRIRFSILNKQKKKLESMVADRTNELSQMNALLEERQEEITLQNHQLYDHRNNLEELVEKRTSELEVAKIKAEESDRLKTAFLHNISHEIRTPLNAIIGFSELLKLPELKDEDRNKFTDIICQSGEQLLLIITDIMHIAALEAGKEIKVETNTNINRILKTIYSNVEKSARKKNILVNYELALSDTGAEVITDHTKLNEILSNLINNAIKFTKSGSVKFGYLLKDKFLEFYVEDTGIGILVEMQEIIFERFRQVENTTVREFGGTGLGLSISKSYVELLGGRIWLTSLPDKGTTFFFTIPYQRDSQPVKQENRLTDLKIPKISPLKKVLVAEDEDLNFALIKELLSVFKIKPIRAVNGFEAVEKCKSDHFDLILMDIKMPVMDGYEATRQIKSFFSNMTIIAQTAYVHDEEKMKIMEGGFTDYLPKPILRSTFISTINKYL